MLDAYAVRKAIPRIVLAVIGINLSIYLCVAANDIATIVGRGLNQLLVTPFIDQNSFKGIQIESNVENNILGVLGVGGALGGAFVAVVGSIGAVGASALAVLGFMLPLIITVALIALAVLFTLVIRQGLLVFLIVVSPVAIACYVLPGTEKYFKQWLDLFTRTLMVYPIIAVIFAMSNVLGAILLSSAAGGSGAAVMTASMVDNFDRFAQTSDAIGTVQIIAAILVLYAPLVLIPFSFKLAGGAMSAVMNAASGRAANLAGRAGQAVQKTRQDPNSYLGSRRLRAQQNRVAKGLTTGQVVGGLSAGIGARARGRSFRSGYQASSGTAGKTRAFDEATAFMENNSDFKAIAGNDDSLWAFRNGTDEASVRKILEARGYTGQGLNETAAMVMRAKAQVGTTAGNIAAARMQAKTGTGYEDNAAMLEDIARASGGDMNVAGRMLAEMRGGAAQSGRMELGTSSFNTQMVEMMGMSEAVASGDSSRLQAARASVNKNVMESVIDSNGSGAAVYGKPSSAKAIAKAHREKISDLLGSLNSGQEIQINGETNPDGTAKKRKATTRDVKQALASANGVHDALQTASPQNARAFADELMGASIDVERMSASTREALGPAIKQGDLDSQDAGPQKGPITVRQVMDGLAGRDQEYMEMRRDFAGQTATEAAQAQAHGQHLTDAQRLQQQGVQPGGYRPGPPTGPFGR